VFAHRFLFPAFLILSVSGPCAAQVLPDIPGAPSVQLTHADGKWTLAGQKNTVVLDESDLSVAVRAGDVTWKTVPSGDKDLLVSTGADEFYLRPADAGEIRISPYATGFKSGVKITLGGFRANGVHAPGSPLDLRLYLTLCLEGSAEELVFEVMAQEGDTVVRELNWPTAIDGREVDYTVLSNDDGMLVPRDWPKPYHPIHRAAGDTSVIQSDLIESWAMSWWGFQKGDAAMIVIVETPDDAGYTFSHPAGGPTSIGPTWRAQLGRFGYLRSLRMDFLPKGNYVDLAKRYRRYVMDTGLFVSLREKIARSPLVKNLIGNPFTGARVLRNLNPESTRYDKQNPESNYRLTTFAENIQRLKELKAKGYDHLNVSLSGWLTLGYDRRTPDALPPSPKAGGWEGMKAFFEACGDLEYTCWVHDQYRDYYLDAPSWNPDFAVHDQDQTSPATAFPGTRFGHFWKEGYIPLMNNWDGGTQGYLNSRFMLGHVIKNFRWMAEHGVHPQGSYQDVFGYVPPDEDFNPEHPNTRTDSMKYRAAVLNWVRHNVGIVGTEDGADWTIPYVDYVTSRLNRNPNSGNDASSQPAVEVPLYELVFHDAVVTSYSATPRGFLHANAPSLSSGSRSNDEQVRRMAALHKRVGLLEMTNHEFLDKERRKERTTFADGTTVTVDWDANTVEITPEVEVGR
jgi:Family of unknown function (DUF5696)